jgi:hypothetical protein
LVLGGIPFGDGSGSSNAQTIAIGTATLLQNTTGSYNVGIGYSTMTGNSTGIQNVGIGPIALANNSTGSNNVAIGYASGTGSGGGAFNNNTFVGAQIGNGSTSVLSNNTVVGSSAGFNMAGNGNVILGNSAGYNYTGSNAFFVGNVQQSSLAGDKAYSLLYGTFAGTAGSTTGQSLTVNGSVGIGTTAPGANYKLDVAGQIHTSGGIVFPDGNIQTVAYTGTCGADYAEAVDVTGDRTKYEPGDILVIDPDAPGKFLKSNQAYSTLVAGIYSTKPGFVGRKQPATPETSATEVPMAMVGRVPTKVSAENGPIKVGDLLVASSTLGHAMKGTDRSLLTGAVVGKALGSLDSGTGVIEVLVTLQ